MGQPNIHVTFCSYMGPGTPEKKKNTGILWYLDGIVDQIVEEGEEKRGQKAHKISAKLNSTQEHSADPRGGLRGFKPPFEPQNVEIPYCCLYVYITNFICIFFPP